ncbi:hypothetical protein [Streptomyces sp. A012304]|uniref:hypothetical protein n=1 Tax=Streptomyces sp. A012304 TaxID=375446 RepID=UPI00222FA4FC|nr:hypothetical protein [Streptomyces sp. A012304]GKQ41701.1 hypothetical protein ALMP_82140 [Streptomyces sp. A012304]
MLRTTTTATLLLIVAVTAVAGCVTLQHPPAPAPPVAPSRPVPSPPVEQNDTKTVQPPALEALQRIGTREPEPRTPLPRQRSAPAAGQTWQAERPPSSRVPPRTRPQPQPRHPRPDRPDRTSPAQPRVPVPDVPAEVPRGTDVCGLGRRYGGWQSDSPEAVICEQAYGR